MSDGPRGDLAERRCGAWEDGRKRYRGGEESAIWRLRRSYPIITWRCAYVPEIEVTWTDIPDPHAPMGARGHGEIVITGVGAAVANSVFNEIGERIRDLAITLDKLM